MDIGLCGIAGVYSGGTPAEKVARRKAMAGATGINRDRIDLFSSESAAFIRQLIAEGVPVLPVYDHVEYGQAATILPSLIEEAGLTSENCPMIEIRNEPYYDETPTGGHSRTAAEYAVEFAECAKVLVGTGIEPGLKVWSDYFDYTTGKWSQGAAGHGWAVDTCQALGWVPARLVAHLYGPQAARGLLGGGPAMGWDSLEPMNDYLTAHNLGVITDVTECGQKASVETNIPAGEVSLAEQASACQQMILEGHELGLQSLYLFASNDGNEGHWGVFTSEYKAKPAVAAIAAAVERIS